MGRILCVANQKGGVGKTTTAVNLAACLARAQKQTLLIDLDPQCNATSGLGQAPVERHPVVCNQPFLDAIIPTASEQLDLLPGSRSFRDVESLAEEAEVRQDILSGYLQNGMKRYDYVLIDSPPSLGPLTRTALASSDEVVMPIQCEYFAMEGLTQMIHVIREVMQSTEGRLEFGGIVLTMFDPALELTWEVEHEVREFFGEIVFETVIPRDVHVCEAPSHGQAVIDYAPRSRGARAYIELTMEVMNDG